MKFRIVETTGAPNFEPCRWQADCGRFKYVIRAEMFMLDAGSEQKTVFVSGLLGNGCDYIEIESMFVSNTFDMAETMCRNHLSQVVIAELQRALEEK
jgi:hypothetical protein